MGQSLSDKQKESIIGHFADPRFAEAMLALVAQVRESYESSSNTPLKDDFFCEAMRSIYDKGGRMAMNRMTEEIRHLSEDATSQHQVRPDQA